MTFLDLPADGVPADAPEALMRPDDVVGAVARFLLRLQAADLPDGAAVAGGEAYLARARARVESGALGAADLDPPYRRSTPELMLASAVDLAGRLAPAEATPVHGSLALAGILIDDGEVVGWPAATASQGDPYVDLAFVARDLAAAIGPAAVPALFDAVGVDRPDPLRLEFWVLIRQLV